MDKRLTARRYIPHVNSYQTKREAYRSKRHDSRGQPETASGRRDGCVDTFPLRERLGKGVFAAGPKRKRHNGTMPQGGIDYHTFKKRSDKVQTTTHFRPHTRGFTRRSGEAHDVTQRER